MAEVIGLAASIASLVQIAGSITKLSYNYISDVKNAPKAQKQYLQEVSALTDVLFRAEQAVQEIEVTGLVPPRPASLTENVIDDCYEDLSMIHLVLERRMRRFIWPFQEKELKKHIETLHKFRSIFSDFVSANILITTNETYQKLNGLVISQDRQQLISKLQGFDEVSKTKPAATFGTGQWFLESKAYQQWCHEPPSVLWCYGSPGVGKSLLTSIAIDDLLHQTGIKDGNVAYYFCDFAARDQQSPVSIFQSLLRQLIEQASPEVVAMAKEGLSDPQKLRNSKDLCQLLCNIGSTQQTTTFLLLDAVDELKDPGSLLANFQALVDSGYKILATSRADSNIQRRLAMAKKLQIQAIASDLHIYIEARIRESDFCDEIDDCTWISETIISKAAPSFLLVKLIVDQLLELATLKQIKQALRSLPSKLDQAFESSIHRIDAQSKSRRDLAHRLIGWITHAHRRLSIEEILHAFAIEEDSDEIDGENIPNADLLLRLCVGLVVLDQATMTVGMVHTTAYEFFRHCSQNATIDKDIARTCILYLSTRTLAQRSCQNSEEMEKRLNDLPFLGYAAQSLSRYVQDQNIEQDLLARLLILLKNPNCRSSAFQALQYRKDFNNADISAAFFNSIPTGQHPLHLAACWNLSATSTTLLGEHADPSASDSQDWTPLHWACSFGHFAVVEVLVKGGASLNKQDSQGWTPLFWAVFSGDISVAKFLLAKGARHQIRSILGWSALHWAISRGEHSMVKVLLEHHTDYLREKESRPRLHLRDLNYSQVVEISGKEYLAPVDMAADVGDRELFDVLISQLSATNANIGDEAFNEIWSKQKFDTPVSNAWRTKTKAENMYGMDVYVSSPTRIESAEPNQWKTRLLFSAIRDSKMPALQLLIELGADVNKTDEVTPLHLAACMRDPRYAKILLEKGADPTLVDLKGQTALHQAIINGYKDTVAALVDGGSDVNATVVVITGRSRRTISNRYIHKGNSVSETPLMLAVGLLLWKWNKPDLGPDATAIAQILFSKGADPNIQDDHGMTALHYACMRPNLYFITGLVRAGARPDIVNDQGETSIHVLAKCERDSCKDIDLVQILELLLCDLTDRLQVELLHMVVQTPDGKSAQTRRRVRLDIQTEPLVAFITPIQLALENTNWAFFLAAMKYGAVIPNDMDFHTIIEAAVRNLNAATIAILATHSPSFETSDTPMVTLIEALASEIQTNPSRYAEALHDFKLILPMLKSLGADINCTDSFGDSAITIASKKMDDEELTQLLLTTGADPWRQNEDGLDAFLNAALNQNRTTLRCLFTSAIQTEKANDYWTRSLESFWQPSDDEMYSLCCCLEYARHIDRADKQGHTLLHSGAKLGNCDLIINLLGQGADPITRNSEGWLPVHYAAFAGHVDAVRCLLPIVKQYDSRGHFSIINVITNPITSTDSASTVLLPRTSILKEEMESFGKSVQLKLPTVASSTKSVPNQISFMEIRNEKRHTMTQHAIETHNLPLLSHLLELGADVELYTEFEKYEHSPRIIGSPLCLAACRGHEDMVIMLLAAGADIGATQCSHGFKDSNGSISTGWSALHLAVFEGHLEVMKLLLDAGANINATTQTWNNSYTRPTGLEGTQKWTGSPLHLAAMSGKCEIVQLLLEKGADVHASTGSDPNTSIETGHGPTALSIVLDKGRWYGRVRTSLDEEKLRCAQLLIGAGAVVDGVADYLYSRDVLKFNGFEELWDKLRSGISDKGQYI